MPAPDPSSSTAWGKAVATTGRPAAMASTKTPEVACSVDSYGSTTTAQDWISAVSEDTSRYAASKDTDAATPRRLAWSMSALRYDSPSLASTFGWVRPATR